jgi:hypothetical protein
MNGVGRSLVSVRCQIVVPVQAPPVQTHDHFVAKFGMAVNPVGFSAQLFFLNLLISQGVLPGM